MSESTRSKNRDNHNTGTAQIQARMSKLVVPIDKLTQQVFELSENEYADSINYHEKFSVVEGFKKGKKILTNFWLELLEDYEDKLPPDAFTREVFICAASAYEQGYHVISFSMALDALTGGTEKRNVYKEQYDALKSAFKKLNAIQITADIAPLLKVYPKYRRNYDGDSMTITGSLLPCKFLEVSINGQKTLAVKILDESPLVTIAKVKNQLLTYDTAPLAIAGQNNTPQVITLKNYLLRRIKSMSSAERKKGLNHSILFETLYRNCGLADADNGKKRDARKVIEETLNHFKAENVIKDFEFERKNGAYRAIKITP